MLASESPPKSIVRINLLDELISISSGSFVPVVGIGYLSWRSAKATRVHSIGAMLGRLQCSATDVGVGEAESFEPHIWNG